jgi:CDP-paratose 2-epimerase
MLHRDHDWQILALDNLKRRGSELSARRLIDNGITFVHGDVRNADDLEDIGLIDLIIECAAEPSVHAGVGGDARYVVGTNLVGTFNCLELARRYDAAMIFLSTSRVYAIAALRDLPVRKTATRLTLPEDQSGVGWSARGINEQFSTNGSRSLYGATKLASELLIEEYRTLHGIPAIVNRCGVISGPWQMGKVDQGFFVLWAARHLYGGVLAYQGFGGTGLQVRDVLHIADLYDLIDREVAHLDALSGSVFNVGGGPRLSVSLRELTQLCERRTNHSAITNSVTNTTSQDIPYYVSDNRLVTATTSWSPRHTIDTILDDVFAWLDRYRHDLAPLLGGSPGATI